MHREAKQREMLACWAEKDLLLDTQKGEWEVHVKRSELLKGFQEWVFKGKIWGEGCSVCDFLLIGWWWGNKVRHHLWNLNLLDPSSLGVCSQHVVTTFQVGVGVGGVLVSV